MNHTNDHFVSCDWGTSHFRLRLVDRATCHILNEFRSTEGIAQLAVASRGTDRSHAFRTTLTRWVDDLATAADHDLSGMPIVISGMAGSSIGWHELPYARLPFALDGHDVIWEDIGPLTGKGRLQRVLLLSGVQNGIDVMRGEETEVLGVSALAADQKNSLGEAVLLLPGTHSKHVIVRDGRIADFRTYMTGELFDVLRKHSVLRHSTQPPDSQAAPADWHTDETRQAFREGVGLARSAPLPAVLFQVRTRQLLGHCSPSSNTAFLSGMLLGAELSCLDAYCPADAPIFLCAGAHLNCCYTMAFDVLGLSDRLTILPAHDVERLAVLGQALVLERILASE